MTLSMSGDQYGVDLETAIEQGNLAWIRQLFAEFPDLIHWRDQDGNSVLHLARGREVLEVFLEAGAQVDSRNKHGWTPLYQACIASFWKVERLLSRGADINARDSRGSTPLHVAAKFMNETHVANLLDHGADIDATNDEGYTPLHASFDDTNPATGHYLWAKGATKDIFGACYLGKIGFVQEAIVENPEVVNAQDGRRRTPLHWASCCGEIPVAKLLLAHGATVDATSDRREWTPLHIAAYYGASADYVTLLLDHGAEVNARDGRGTTPLHLAARQKRSGKVRLLVDRGAEVNAVDSLGGTPLDMAIECRKPEIAEILRSHGGTATGREPPKRK